MCTNPAPERVDVSDWAVSRVETAGSSAANWLVDPSTGDYWLHKDVTAHDWGCQGEDWAEVVSTQVGALMHVPCAETRLCMRNGKRGSLSRSLKVEGYDFNEGGVTLEAANARGYIRNEDRGNAFDPARPKVVRPGHNLENIRALLKDFDPPAGFDGPRASNGFDAFCGMLLFDALIANRDRHEQNWAVLRAQLLGSPDRLAASYDHCGSLGYNLQDEKRERMLNAPDGVRQWAERGTAWRFEHEGKPLTLVRLAGIGVTMCGEAAQEWWRTVVVNLDLSPIAGLLTASIPDMSELASTFALEVLKVNLRRLQDELSRA